MSKIIKIKGILPSLIDSITSVINKKFMSHIASTLKDDREVVKIDFLTEKITPKKVSNSITKKTVKTYKKWLLEQFDKNDIDKEIIKEASMTIQYRPGLTVGYYECIGFVSTIKGKEIRKKKNVQI